MSGPPMPSTSNANASPVSGGHASGSTIPGRRLRRWFYLLLVVVSGLAGGRMMLEILRPNGLTPLEFLLLVLFTSTFTWVVSAFWSAVVGCALQLLRRDPYSLQRLPDTPQPIPPLRSRTAVVMPVYNEDTARIIAGFETTIRSLAQTGRGEAFEFYLLSDTRDPALARAERVAWQGLRQRLGPLAEGVYYRRRRHNRNRKVGNLADFCRRWGYRYDYMIVLDADSIMSGDCITSLTARMEANPHAGLIQTVPIPVRQQTLFGRFLQFAAELYSPMLAAGFAFWHSDNGNYWGHNAIIRVGAFMECCGLPTLAGRAPFGGEILSHDFVEAALLCRGGWGVYLATDLDGSYEEVPGNILDYVKRDRRWVQGNLQHLSLLGSAGLSAVSRMHLLFGALAYLSSLAWLGMLLFSTIDAVLRATRSEVFFSQAYQLFPDWPQVRTGLIMSLLYVTVVVLFTPKIMGCVHALIHRRQQFGGAAALLRGALLELFSATIIAPVMMCYHACFVLSVLLGFDVDWGPQPREGRIVGWREAWRRSYPLVLSALAWGSVTAWYSPLFFCWLIPVLTGMLLAPVLIRYTSSRYAGAFARDRKLWITPSEHRPDPVLQILEDVLARLPQHFTGTAPDPELPPVQWRAMPQRSLQWQRPTWRSRKQLLPQQAQ